MVLKNRIKLLKESIEKEDHIEAGIFPMEEFQKGLKAEMEEHSEYSPLVAARLVLDHLEEDEYYYSKNNEGVHEDISKLRKQGLAADEIAKKLNVSISDVNEVISKRLERLLEKTKDDYDPNYSNWTMATTEDDAQQIAKNLRDHGIRSKVFHHLQYPVVAFHTNDKNKLHALTDDERKQVLLGKSRTFWRA